MKESYLFHARIKELLPPVEIWASCLPIIKNFSTSMGDMYHISSAAAKVSVNIPYEEILKVLNYPEATSYLISWDRPDFDHTHSFSYFEKLGKLSFRFAKDISLKKLDEFGFRLANALPISNIIVQQSSYLDLLREFHVPNRTNLHLAPCYSNGRDGYIEGVSAEMWLGEPFWQYAECTKMDLLSQDWLYCEERPSHLYVRAWPEPFTSAEGEQGEIQRKLLDLLFGINGMTPPPLPSPPPSTLVQKVLVAGEEVKDLGMEEVRPDGTRVRVSSPEPPPLPESDEVILEKTIRAINEQPWIGEAVLFSVMLSTKGFLIVPDPSKPDQFATVRHPESGEEMLVCYTSEKFVKAVGEKAGVTTSHVTYGPFLDVFKECKGDLGIILNPATDVTIAISAASAKTAGEIAAQNHNQRD